MDDSSIVTLARIEALLVSELANPQKALRAAYELGKIDGLLAALRIGENKMIELDFASVLEQKPS